MSSDDFAKESRTWFFGMSFADKHLKPKTSLKIVSTGPTDLQQTPSQFNDDCPLLFF